MLSDPTYEESNSKYPQASCGEILAMRLQWKERAICLVLGEAKKTVRTNEGARLVIIVHHTDMLLEYGSSRP